MPDSPSVRRPDDRRSYALDVFTRIDHIGIAVADLEAAVAVHEQAYGMREAHRETLTEQGVEAVLFDVGENHIELLRPLADDTPIGRFLERRGPGLHHVAYQVPDLDAALAELREGRVRMIDPVPRIGIRGSRVAFVHPSATASVLTELVEPATVHV
jgi:methylmalonyl-CoA/ethylmalonyl-CoA epimerase